MDGQKSPGLQGRHIHVRVPEEVLGGVYANNMIVGHTREEFVMDFLFIVHEQAVVSARVITSPGHMKRILRALAENVKKYEARFGEISEAVEPKDDVLIQ